MKHEGEHCVERQEYCQLLGLLQPLLGLLRVTHRLVLEVNRLLRYALLRGDFADVFQDGLGRLAVLLHVLSKLLRFVLDVLDRGTRVAANLGEVSHTPNAVGDPRRELLESLFVGLFELVDPLLLLV